jgi:hypothetical protein
MSNSNTYVSPEKQSFASKAFDAPSCHHVWKKICDAYKICACPWCEKRARSEDLFENGVAVHIDNVDPCEFMHDYVYNINPLAFNVSFVRAKYLTQCDLLRLFTVLGFVLYLLGNLSNLLWILQSIDLSDGGLSVFYVVLLQTKYWSVGGNNRVESYAK